MKRNDVDDEVRFHIERKVEALVRGGMSREEARAEAIRRFGNVDRIKEQMTTMTRKREERRRKSDAWDALRLDVAYALRQLLRAPGFTAVAILTLTLGIGATTAIFSVVDGILLRPLPFEKPEQLVAVWSDWTARGGPADEWPNFPNLWGLREQATSLAGVGMTAGSSGTLTGIDGPAEFIQGSAVSYDMFASVLRVEPEIGRGFSVEDDTPGTPRVILLSNGLWTRAFGADPSIVKKTITLNGNPLEVIGVMAESFRPPPILQGDYWIPLKQDMSNFTCGIGGACLQSIARLADGATLASAEAEAKQIAGRQAQQEQENTGIEWTLRPLQYDMVANARTGLFVVLGAAGFVLLIACVNQASLLLARGTGRRAELAIRSAIGADRGRIVTQLMVESMVLALLGGATGIGAAYLLTDLLVALAPAYTPRIDEVAVNGRVLGFAALITMLSGLFFGIVPALRIAGTGPHDSLREGSRGDPRAAGVRIRQGLVVAQVGLALMLLTGSGLLLRTFQNLRDVELGFRPEGALTFRINLPAARYELGEPIVAFHRELEEKLAAIPGVESVALTTSLPLGGFNTDRGFIIQGRPIPPSDQSQSVWYQGVTPELLRTMGTSVVQGRGIADADVAEAPGVVVVNEAFAKRYFPSGDALGQRIGFGMPCVNVSGTTCVPPDQTWNEIVGVAQDVRHFDLRGEARPALYMPFAQLRSRAVFYVVRSELDPESVIADVRGAISSVDPELAAGQIAPLEDFVGNALSSERFVAMLLGLFAAVAVTLAVVGLYGVVSYNVNTRVREMGVRLALGASGGSVVALVVRRSLWLVGIGLTLGLLASAGLTRFLGSLLFGVEAGDPITFALAFAALAAAATLASLLPARRAAGVQPSTVLRED